MKIFLIRHGQTTGDIEDRYGGDYDDHLTDEGKVQAASLANKLADKKIEKIFYSPLMRAKETTLAIHEKIGMEIEAVEGLRERNRYGILTGMTKQEARLKYPELITLLENDTNTIQGAESYEHFQERILRTFTDITNKKHNVVGIVTHGGPIKLLFQELVGKEIKKVEDCGFAVLEKANDKMTLLHTDGILFS